MFYIVGLGNPGEKYQNTRHNIGFLALEKMQSDLNFPNFVSSSKNSGDISEGVLSGEEVLLLKPDTYMNNSGSAVKKTVSKSEAASLIVVYDDVDLPLGEIKISVGRGHGGHNGIRSIIDSLGSKDFIRVRVGISPTSFWTGKVKRPGGDKLSRHVLGDFKKREGEELNSALSKTVKAIETTIEKGVEKAMNEFN